MHRSITLAAASAFVLVVGSACSGSGVSRTAQSTPSNTAATVDAVNETATSAPRPTPTRSASGDVLPTVASDDAVIRTPQWEYVVTGWTERGVATGESFSLCGVVAPESREYRTVIIDGFIRNTSQELIKIDSLRNYGSDLWPMIENRSGLTVGQGRFVRYVQLGGLLSSPYLKNGTEVTEGSYGEPTAEYLPPGYGIPVSVIGEYCALVNDYGLTIRQTDTFVPAGHVMRDPDMLNPNVPTAAVSVIQEITGWDGDLKYVFSNPTIVSQQANGRQEQELQLTVTNQSTGVNVFGIATQILVYLPDGRVVSGDFDHARNPQTIPPGSTGTLRYLITASRPTTGGNPELYGLVDFDDAIVVLSVSTESRAWRLPDGASRLGVAPSALGRY